MNMEARGITYEPQIQEERMGDEEFGNLLAAVGNGEHKALLLATMALSPGTIFTGRDMRSKMAEAQGLTTDAPDETGWIESSSAYENYCGQSFGGIGLVSKEVKDEKHGVFGYQITEKGLAEGIALAGLMTDYAMRHAIPLRHLLSETSSQGSERTVKGEDGIIIYKNRAPMARVKILKTLLAIPLPARVTDVSYQMIGLDRNTVGNHAKSLGENGVIDFKSAPKEGPRVHFKLKQLSDDIPFHPKDKALSKNAYEMFVKNPDHDFTMDEMAQRLIEEGLIKGTKESVRGRLGKVLPILRSGGIIDTPHFSNDKRTQITLTVDQRNKITELIEILEKFRSRDQETIALGKKLAFQFATNPQEMREALTQARGASSRDQLIPTGEINRAILTAISEFPDATIDGVREYLRSHFEYILQPSTLSNYLRGLRRDGKLVSQTKGGSILHWRIVA